jgi:hypothetical protein
LLQIDTLVELIPIIASKPSQKRFPKYVFLNTLLVEVARVDHHVFVHNIDDARGQ